jgi:hypothetical protein
MDAVADSELTVSTRIPWRAAIGEGCPARSRRANGGIAAGPENAKE